MAPEHRSGILEDSSAPDRLRRGVAGAVPREHRPEPSRSSALDRPREPGRDLPECNGVRAVPSVMDPEGYDSCPSCVIDAGETFVALDESPEIELPDS